MSKFKMKILKKTKYFIPYGDVVTYQIRQSKIRTLGHSVYRNNSPTTRYTHGVYIVSKPVPAEASQEHQYTVGCTRKYKYVVDEELLLVRMNGIQLDNKEFFIDHNYNH